MLAPLKCQLMWTNRSTLVPSPSILPTNRFTMMEAAQTIDAVNNINLSGMERELAILGNSKPLPQRPFNSEIPVLV